jgi:hypothetical protein
MGSRLVMVDNAAEQAALQKGIAAGAGTFFWTAGTYYRSKYGKEHWRWYWADWPNNKITYEGKDVAYTNWANGEPNDYGGKEGNMIIHSYKSYKWADMSGASKFGFICEQIVTSCT